MNPLNFRHRFRLVEARLKSALEIIANPTITEQAGRSAEFECSEIEGTWNRLKRWPAFSKTKAMCVHDNKLIVGLSGLSSEIWSLEQDWNLLQAFPGFLSTNAISSHYGKIFAAVDRNLFTFYSDRWTDLGNFPSEVYCLASFGDLYVGLIGDTRVFRFDGHLREVSKGLPLEGFAGVYELWPHDGQLYAGLISNAGATLIYRLDDDHWICVGGRGINNSWRSAGFTFALSFGSHQGRLIVTMNRNPLVHGHFSSIWAFDGANWEPVCPLVPSIWGEMDNYNATLSFRNNLFVGAGGAPPGNASVWHLQKNWKRIGQWRFNRFNQREYVYRLIEWDSMMIAGFGDGRGAAQVWSFTPQ